MIADSSASDRRNRVNTLFSLQAWAQFLIFAGAALCFFAVADTFFRTVTRYAGHLEKIAPLPTFIGAITTAWALSLGFAAADVWSVRANAERLASAERSSISRLAGMARGEALDSPQLRRALSLYATAVDRDEWKRDYNTQGSSEVESALQQVRLALIALAQAGTPDALIDKMARDFDELQDARNERLAIGQSAVSNYKWYLVLFLTMLSMLTIAIAHIGQPRAARNALVIFALASFVSLWILALHANPYRGAARIEFTRVQT